MLRRPHVDPLGGEAINLVHEQADRHQEIERFQEEQARFGNYLPGPG
jgi:hypothetical protein